MRRTLKDFLILSLTAVPFTLNDMKQAASISIVDWPTALAPDEARGIIRFLNSSAQGIYALFSSLIDTADRYIAKSTTLPRYDQLSDADLVFLIRNGDKNAFEHIYKVHVQHLYRFARKNISVHEDCEEIIQNVFLSLWERHQTLNIVTIKFYLLNCVRYGIIHYIRRKKIIQKYRDHFLLFEAVYDTLPENEKDPDTVASILEKSIEQLPPRCQQVVKLRLSEDLSNKEIAERLNITTRTVEAQFYRAFNQLRVHLKGNLKLGM